MISISLARDGAGRLIPSCDPRRPDESLYDYLVRSRHEMGVQIRMLEAHSDAQAELFASEQTRWRRAMVMLAIGEAGFAAAGYVALHQAGLAESLSTPLVATMIASCALGGAVTSLFIASLRIGIASWPLAAADFARHLLRRNARPSETERLARDFDRQLGIETIIEERAADCLEMETFFWGLRLLLLETAIVVLLVSIWRAMLGLPFDAVISDAVLVTGICLIGGLFLLLLSDLVSTSLARFARWWKRR